eukprot:6692542-Ditylum_brightwellii.AAC.1
MEHRMDLWEKGDFVALVEDTGKLHQAVRWVTGRNKGGLLQPTNIDSKTGNLVSDMLLGKHPVLSQPLEETLQSYDKLPLFMDIDVTTDTIKRAAARMQGAAGPGRVDSITWQDWLLRYGEASQKLRKAVAHVARWLANTTPAWAAYRAIVTGCLIVLDKCPGIRPVGVGKILLRMLGKCIIA